MSGPPLILLAHSEAKAPGGEPGRLEEDAAQAWVRRKLQALVRKADPDDLARTFGLKPPAALAARAEAMALGGEVPLRPALARYTGVAFQALHPADLAPELWARVWLLSPLRGLVRGDGPLPPYKLKLDTLPGLREHWRKHLPARLAALPPGPLWELLPGDHAGLLRDWDRPRHGLAIERAGGGTVSHAAKLFRGRVAGWLLRHGQDDPARVLRGGIEGARWRGLRDNATGGVDLILEVP